MNRRSVLPAAIGFALSSTGLVAPGLAQTGAPPPVEATIPVTYVGSNARVSLGINDDGDVLGELLGIFGKTDEQAWLVGGWLGQGGAGGVQLDYHWLHGSTDDAIERPESVSVWKAFGAWDQNAWKDSKVSLGLGWEKNDLELGGYLSAATSGSRLQGSSVATDVSVINGSDAQGDYTQTQTIDTLTEVFEHPYDYGIGLRAARYFDEPLLRVRGGLDYERGDYDSDQWTASLGLDKYFRNSGFSLSLLGESLHKGGQFEIDKNDTRGWLLLRYEFGQNYRAREPYRMVEAAQPAAQAAPPPTPQVVRNEVRLDGDAFFDFDHHDLRPDAVAALNELISKLASSSRVSRVTVVGHTDSIGSVAYNQKLSERRAESARSYLVAHGIDADQIDIRGEGELNPTFPNDTRANRQKNRRVDVDFLSIEETTAAVPAPPPESHVEWVREPVKVPPAWIERALRDPTAHKRTVDVYRFEKSTDTTTLGPKEYANHPPVARDDNVELATCPPVITIDALANDSDPDGDPLTIIETGPTAFGIVTIGAGGELLYAVRPGSGGVSFCGVDIGGDHFTYTISDGRGGTSTAEVTLRVVSQNQPPVAGPLSVRVLKGSAIDIPVLQAASDPDGDPLTVTEVAHTGPLPDNTVSINADGTVHYQSVHGWFGQDYFEYTVSDGRGGTATGTIAVYVFEPPRY